MGTIQCREGGPSKNAEKVVFLQKKTLQNDPIGDVVFGVFSFKFWFLNNRSAKSHLHPQKMGHRLYELKRIVSGDRECHFDYPSFLSFYKPAL